VQGSVQSKLCRYVDGDEKYISIEGVPYQNLMLRAGHLIKMVQKLPTSGYLLEPSNQVIGDVLGRAFEQLAPPSAHVTLSWLRELQRTEIAVQNKLSQDPDAVHSGQIEVM
jgi:hypothetical protein